MINLGLPEEGHYSPAIIIVEFNNLLNTVGSKAVFSQRKYQEDRELWIGALFALGFRAFSHKPHWVGYGYGNTPDAVMVTFVESSALPEKGQDRLETNIEIMEYDQATTLSLEEELIKKFRKQYPKYFVLLIFARKEDIFHHDELSKMVTRHKPNIGGVWFLGGNIREMNLWQLYPEQRWVKYNPIETAKSWPEKDIITSIKGTGYGVTPTPPWPKKDWKTKE